MLQKHIEKVRGRSEDYKKFYSLGISFLFTGVIALFWVSAWLIPSLSTLGVATVDNSASVSNAVDGGADGGVSDKSADLSPTGVIKQEAGNAVGTSVDSSKDTTYGAQDSAATGDSSALTPPSVVSKTTQSGITIETEGSNGRADLNGSDNLSATSSGYDSSTGGAWGN